MDGATKSNPRNVHPSEEELLRSREDLLAGDRTLLRSSTTGALTPQAYVPPPPPHASWRSSRIKWEIKIGLELESLLSDAVVQRGGQKQEDEGENDHRREEKPNRILCIHGTTIAQKEGHGSVHNFDYQEFHSRYLPGYIKHRIPYK